MKRVRHLSLAVSLLYSGFVLSLGLLTTPWVWFVTVPLLVVMVVYLVFYDRWWRRLRDETQPVSYSTTPIILLCLVTSITVLMIQGTSVAVFIAPVLAVVAGVLAYWSLMRAVKPSAGQSSAGV